MRFLFSIFKFEIKFFNKIRGDSENFPNRLFIIGYGLQTEEKSLFMKNVAQAPEGRMYRRVRYMGICRGYIYYSLRNNTRISPSRLTEKAMLSLRLI